VPGERKAGTGAPGLGTFGPIVARGRADYLARMTDRASIDDVLNALADEFDLLGDWESRIQYVIDLGRELAPLPDADRIEANKVPGCAAQVWLTSGRDGDRLAFRADSDSAISKGNVALLLRLYSDRTPAEIMSFDARAALDRLGLPQALTRQRANGLNSMVGRIRETALEAG
jgi:cysteine desulfuration protein SufE